ncbi:MAG: hypothetical protein N3A01_06080 [Bacteroidales bacterium]|nr:hypothetical protein [Bacteroidales bacterium]
MGKIKFGTDGWRGIIAKDFTVENVIKISQATVKWLRARVKSPKVVVAYDFRFNGKLFAETVAKIFANNDIVVYYCPTPTSTPALSLGVVKKEASLGIMITASHNPPEYNGYKLKGPYGGPLLEESLREIELLISDSVEINVDSLKWSDFLAKNLIVEVNLDELYIENVKKNFDLTKIKESKFKFAFNAMYGSGQNIMKSLFPEILHYNCEANPSFNGIPPEPIPQNLKDFMQFIKKHKNISLGLVVDGDADRIGLIDGNGNYIDSHSIMLLLIYYLAKYKKLKGKVVTGFSSTIRIEKLCKYFGLPVERVKIGFKDICKIMLKEDVLVGGEESGGITIKGHIPERDGIWMGLTIWTAMIETNKTIEELLNEIYEITGKYYYSRLDLKIEETKRPIITEFLKSNSLKSINKEKIIRVETLDGHKFFFNENEWLMIRLSGTEQLVRIYCEATTKERVDFFIDEAKKIIEKL